MFAYECNDSQFDKRYHVSYSTQQKKALARHWRILLMMMYNIRLWHNEREWKEMTLSTFLI